MSFVADLSALVAASVDHRHCCPDGWSRVPLGSVAEIINGFPFKSGGFGAAGHPVIRIRDVSRGFTNTRFDGDAPASLWVEAGDLIVGMDGDFQTAFWRSEPALLNQRVCKIVADEIRIDRRYLAHVLPGYLELINANTPSVTVKHLSSKTLGSIPLPLPPLARQKAIADRIDELFAEIDDGEAALISARDDLATWRKALLKAAVTGELTADWRAANPPGETGPDLLAHILVNRRARWATDAKNKGKRYVEPLAPAAAGLPTLPDGWAWSSMGQLLDRIDAGLNVKCVERPPQGAETGLVKISAVTWWRFNERASKTLADSHVHPDQWLIANGDLLVSRANTLELVGAPAVVEGLSLRLMLSDKVLRLAMPAFLRRWAFYVMRSPYGRAWIEGRSTGNQLSMRNISQDALRAMPIPLPPRTELDHIVELLNAASSQHEATANDVVSFDATAATLRQSILSAAFRGDLA